MAAANQHITEFLDYYIALPKAPEYAILLTGSWGSGKSWYIKQYIEQHKSEDNKFLYISLNGLSTFAEIDDRLFEQLHPVLSNPKMKLAGKLLKGLLKTTIHVDLDKDGKADGNVSSGIPDINIPDYMKNVGNRTLVFDDLERCKLDTAAVLGYINDFVENKGLKVVILANETELLRKEDAKEKDSQDVLDPHYRLIKEKLIGKSLLIEADLVGALTGFLEDVQDHPCKQFLVTNRAIVEQAYLAHTGQNLRYIKQSLLDFERFFRAIPIEFHAKQYLLETITTHFFMLALPLKSGVPLEEMLKANHPFKQEEGSLFDASLLMAFTALGLPSLVYLPVSNEIWHSYFTRGTVDAAKLDASIRHSAFFATENTPAWNRLWRVFSLEDAEFDQLFQEVGSDLQQYKITDVGVLMHVVCTCIYLCELKLIDVSKPDILSLGIKNVKNLRNKGLLLQSTFAFDAYAGLGFHGLDIHETQIFLAYVRKAIDESIPEKLQQAGKELLDLFQKKPTRFGRTIGTEQYGDQGYHDMPVLPYIDPIGFVETFLKLRVNAKRELGSMIRKRYEHLQPTSVLRSEKGWLVTVKDQIAAHMAQHPNKVSTYINEQVFHDIQQAIAIIDHTPSITE